MGVKGVKHRTWLGSGLRLSAAGRGVIVSDGRRGTSIAPQPPALGGRERERKLAEAAEQFAIAIVQLDSSVADARRALDASLERVTRAG